MSGVDGGDGGMGHRVRCGRPKGSEDFGGCVATQKLPTKVATKSPGQSVSYSEAASGLHTGWQGTDAVASFSGSPYSVRL